MIFQVNEKIELWPHGIHLWTDMLYHKRETVSLFNSGTSLVPTPQKSAPTFWNNSAFLFLALSGSFDSTSMVSLCCSLEVLWYENSTGASLVNLSALPAILNSSCLHKLTRLSDVSAQSSSTYVRASLFTQAIEAGEILLVFSATTPNWASCLSSLSLSLSLYACARAWFLGEPSWLNSFFFFLITFLAQLLFTRILIFLPMHLHRYAKCGLTKLTYARSIRDTRMFVVVTLSERTLMGSSNAASVATVLFVILKWSVLSIWE